MNRGITGLIADTHSRNDLLETAIEHLRSLGAEKLVHLGDICDSHNPRALDDAVKILIRNNVLAVLGNNDYIVIADGMTDGLSEDTVRYLKELPYTIRSGGITYTHSSPFEWPAATRRPISEFIPSLNPEKHRLIFRGHSHTPSVVEIKDGIPHKIKIPADRTIGLEKGSRYIITIGAVEKSSAAIFNPEKYEVRFLEL
jgi:predicted phosphodiesterase